MDLEVQKKAERKRFLELRNNMPIELKKRYDDVLNIKLTQRLNQDSTQNIHVFLPMKSEPNIYPFIQFALSNHHVVICPKCLPGGKMENYILTSLDQLERGIFGTSHPKNAELFKGIIDMVVVPGLAFSISKERLGYGGGYYDRFLAEHPGADKCAIAYPFQVVDNLPIEDHDIAMDSIISP